MMRIEKIRGSVWEVYPIHDYKLSKFLEDKKTLENHVFVITDRDPVEGWVGPKSSVEQVLEVAEELGFPVKWVC
jgi:hypothetical protein